MKLADIVQRGWEALGAGNLDALVSDYTDDMIFIMPGQSNVLEGAAAFRSALGQLNTILPPGFEIKGLRHLEGNHEVVTIVEWSSARVPTSQLSILFRFRGEQIFEVRWFIDTKQWDAAF